MIGRLARRLGVEQAVPVSVIDDWILPRNDSTVALAPRGGTATCLVDPVGRIQPAGRSYTIDWTIAAGARWVSAIESERVTQGLLGTSVIETVVETPAGTVVHRVAAAFVDGEPVALIEVENQGGVAIAIGLVARPLVHGGRGYLPAASAALSALDFGDQGALRFERAAAVAVSDRDDLLGAMSTAQAEPAELHVASRSGAAQAAAVFALPHTVSVRAVLELGAPVRPGAAVPSIADVERGWQRHLEGGSRIAVGDTGVGDRLAIAARVLLTGWPSAAAAPTMIRALAELGFGGDAIRIFPMLDRLDETAELIATVARWCQLGEAHDQLDALDSSIGPIARSAQAAARVDRLIAPPWAASAFEALANRLELIDQPDVADRIRSFSPVVASTSDNADLAASSVGPPDLVDPTDAARLVIGARAAVIDDRGPELDLLPALPESWRGRTIEVHDAPIEAGTVSFGVRWHGSRPALLWQVDQGGAPVKITAAAIDASFSTTEPSGEALLNDPGWPRR